MDSIKNIVSGVIEKLSSSRDGPFTDIQVVWEKISKDHGSRVADFKDGCVFIIADSAMRLVRLNFNREAILKELRKEFPSVVKISFKAGTRRG